MQVYIYREGAESYPKGIGKSTTNKSSVCVQAEDLMEVVEIEMDKMPEHYGGGASEKLMEASESDATRIMEKGSCCSSWWVVEMQKMLEDANPSVERARGSRHSIYRVPQFMKDMTNSEAYSPRFVSLGLLHHGEPHLLPMEAGAQAPGGGAHG